MRCAGAPLCPADSDHELADPPTGATIHGAMKGGMPTPPPSTVRATNAMRRRVTSTSRLSARPPATPPIILSLLLRCMRNGGRAVVVVGVEVSMFSIPTRLPPAPSAHLRVQPGTDPDATPTSGTGPCNPRHQGR